EKEPRWILLTAEQVPASLVPAADIARYMQTEDVGETIKLNEIPARRQDVAEIDFQATLQEALEKLNNSDAEALYVTRRTIPGISRIYGIITRNDIDQYYTVQ
ncbi:MAG: chloride channel protein, partial [Gammaproteobacteria bacterium]|nr:chloride channel protein [Gammaproteobacteria bacterium]